MRKTDSLRLRHTQSRYKHTKAQIYADTDTESRADTNKHTYAHTRRYIHTDSQTHTHARTLSHSTQESGITGQTSFEEQNGGRYSSRFLLRLCA